MNTEKHKVKITANSVDEFKAIEKLLNTLPEAIFVQIESAKNGGVGIECTFKQNYKTEATYMIPPPRQISDFDDYIGIYSACREFFFKIDGANLKNKKTYVIIETEKKK